MSSLSVILATDTYATIEPVVDHLREQTIREQIELVIATASEADLGLEAAAAAPFARVQVVEHDPTDLPAARAAAIRAASSPIVFMGETHTYAHPQWAEKLVHAHENGWAVVVPGFGNANPENVLSWAAFVSDYGPWAEGMPAGPTEMFPIYNSAYKRDDLLALDPDLDALLAPSDSLVLRLREEGCKAYFEPAARIDHVNVSKVGTWLQERYLGGLVTASARRVGWSPVRKALYVVGSPLIPFVLLYRLRGALAGSPLAASLPRGTRAAITLGSFVYGFGELVGYAMGASPRAERRMTDIELHRLRYVAGS